METFSALLAICAGNSPVPGEFPAQRPVTQIFDVFFDLRLNKRVSKQSRVWWFETLSRPLWRHRNERWRENPATSSAEAGFSQHLECGIQRSDSSPKGSLALIPHPPARLAKLPHNASTPDDVLSIETAKERCLQTRRFHNHARQSQRQDRPCETSGTLWIHGGTLINQRCSLATRDPFY